MPSAIDHARALIRAAKEGSTPPPAAVAWAGGGLELAIYQGVDFPVAFALTGHCSPEKANALERRDNLLRDVRGRWFP